MPITVLVMPVKRFDRGELRKPVRMDNGWLRVDAYLTRAGVFEYQNPDGSIRREYRDPTEVFKADSMATFDLVPLTNEHPADGLLTAENTKKYQVGMVSGPRQDDDKMAGSILVTDAATIQDMEAGKRELSNGYLCDLVEQSGTSPSGERYDARQTNIRGNHVALVAIGRAGADVRVRFDSADPFKVASKSDSDSARHVTLENVMRKIRFDGQGLTVEVSEEAAAAIEAERAKLAEETKAAKSAAEKNAARADAAEAEVAKLKAELAGAPEKARKAVEARVALETTARKALGEEARFDGKTDRQIREMVATKAAPAKVKLDSMSDDYVQAMFDLAVEKLEDAQDEQRSTEGTARVDAAVKEDRGNVEARKRFDEAIFAPLSSKNPKK